MRFNLPACPYQFAELRRLCRRVTRSVPTLTLGTHTITVHDIHPDYVAPGVPVNEHEHSFYEAHLFLEGGGIYANAQQQVMGKAGMLLHEPHMPHAWHAYDKASLRMLFWFSAKPAIIVTRPLSLLELPSLWWEMVLLLHDVDVASSGWGHRASARLSVVLSTLLSHHGIALGETDEGMTFSEAMSTVQVVDQFLRDNLARPITLTDVANVAAMSQRSVCRHFQQATGETIMDRLYNMRMERAATLLAESNMTLHDIAREVGLTDPSYFCRRFRQFFNMTPEHYRKGVQHSNASPREQAATAE